MIAVAGIEALVILILLCALIYGQPASVQADRDQFSTQSTQVARYRATIEALPTATPRPCPGHIYYMPSC